MSGAMGKTVSGERVIRITDHMGMIRGEIAAGIGRDGHTIWQPRFWHPDGRLTSARPTQHDLDLSSIIDEASQIADEIGRKKFGRSVDDFLNDDDVPF